MRCWRPWTRTRDGWCGRCCSDPARGPSTSSRTWPTTSKGSTGGSWEGSRTSCSPATRRRCCPPWRGSYPTRPCATPGCSTRRRSWTTSWPRERTPWCSTRSNSSSTPLACCGPPATGSVSRSRRPCSAGPQAPSPRTVSGQNTGTRPSTPPPGSPPTHRGPATFRRGSSRSSRRACRSTNASEGSPSKPDRGSPSVPGVDTPLRYHKVHGSVVRIRGNLGHDLNPKRPGDERRRLRQAARQEAVVETAAIPEASRPSIEGYARDEREIHPTGVGRRGPGRPRLAYAPRPRLQVHLQVPNLVESQRAALDPREQEGLPVGHDAPQKLVGPQLGSEGGVGQDDTGVFVSREVQDGRDDAPAQEGAFSIGQRVAAEEDRPAQGGFGLGGHGGGGLW